MSSKAHKSSSKHGSKHESKHVSKHGSKSELKLTGSSVFNIASVEMTTRSPDVSKFSKDELAIFDADGFSRTFLTVKFNEVGEKVFDGMRSITRLQYQLPIKYLKPVENSFSYVSQKSYINSTDDMKNASIVIEPLNAAYSEIIPYTPINQHIPIGTPVTIDVSVPFDTLPDGTEPDRRFIWSSNLKTIPDIEKEILKSNPKSIRTKPWQECVHYGSIDIGSKLECKFTVDMSDPVITRSFNVYGFRFDHDAKYLVIWVFKCFNLTPVDVLKMIRDNENCVQDSKEFIDEILSHVK